MPKRTRPYREGLLEDLRNPELAAHYLSVALEDSDEMFVDSLRDVAEANGYPLPGPGNSPDVPAVLALLRALRLRLALAS